MLDTVEQKQKECFIITPVGDENTDIRRAAEGVIDAAVIPVLKKLGFKENVPHRLWGSGSITKKVINMIVNNDLAIANLTGLNPNVMYELGIRHSARKPVIHICENETLLPFDIKPERTIFYVNDMAGILKFQKNLEEAILAVLKEDKINNPVYDAIEIESLMQGVDPTEKNPLQYIVKRLDSIERNMGDQSIEWKIMDQKSNFRKRLVSSSSIENSLVRQLKRYIANEQPIPDEFIANIENWGENYNEMDKSKKLLLAIRKYKDEKGEKI